MERYVERDYEIEGENKQSDVLGSIQTFKQEYPKTDFYPNNLDKLPETELADVIYIFTSPDKPGIKLHSRSPRSALHFGVFETDVYSISVVNWDKEKNNPNNAELVRTRTGSVVVKTYMVSEQEMLRIKKSILRQRDNISITINITQNKLTSNIDYNNTKDIDLSDLVRSKDELLNKFDTSENNYSNKKI